MDPSSSSNSSLTVKLEVDCPPIGGGRGDRGGEDDSGFQGHSSFDPHHGSSGMHASLLPPAGFDGQSVGRQTVSTTDISSSSTISASGSSTTAAAAPNAGGREARGVAKLFQKSPVIGPSAAPTPAEASLEWDLSAGGNNGWGDEGRAGRAGSSAGVGREETPAVSGVCVFFFEDSLFLSLEFLRSQTSSALRTPGNRVASKLCHWKDLVSEPGVHEVSLLHSTPSPSGDSLERPGINMYIEISFP